MADSPIIEPPGFSDLSKSEQVRYLQALWDRIAARPGDLPAPESHLRLAEDRLADHQGDPRRARPAYHVFRSLGQKPEVTTYRLIAEPAADLDIEAEVAWTILRTGRSVDAEGHLGISDGAASL